MQKTPLTILTVVGREVKGFLKPHEVNRLRVINSRMYFSLRFLKKLNFGSKKHITLHQRSQNIPTHSLRKRAVYVSRGLYPVKYITRLVVKPNVLKYGMFSFTRKPFAIPEKKTRKKR